MDGDGSISKNPKDKRLSIVSTESFCKTMQNIISQTLGVHCSIMYCHNKTTSTRVLQIAGGNQVKKFLDWIYDDAELFLERKRDIHQKVYCA